jgi:hypothetical protein
MSSQPDGVAAGGLLSLIETAEGYHFPVAADGRAEYVALRDLEEAVGELLEGRYFTGVTAAKFRAHVAAIEEARNRGR